MRVILSCLILVLAACTTPPTVVKLSNQAQNAGNVLGNAYVADLEQFRAYDAQRVEEFNRLVNQYEKFRSDFIREYEKAFEHAKERAKAQLYQEFEEGANRLMANDFWVAFRASVGARGGATELINFANLKAKFDQKQAHPQDARADASFSVAAREFYRDAAFLYSLADESFAQLVLSIQRERVKFRSQTAERFAALKLNTSTAAPFKAPNFRNEANTKVVADRIREVQRLRAALESANSEISTYLQSSKVPWKDFAKGALSAFISVSETGEVNGAAIDLAKDSRDAETLELDKLRTEFTDKLKNIDVMAADSKLFVSAILDDLKGDLTKITALKPAPNTTKDDEAAQ